MTFWRFTNRIIIIIITSLSPILSHHNRSGLPHGYGEFGERIGQDIGVHREYMEKSLPAVCPCFAVYIANIVTCFFFVMLCIDYLYL